MRTNRLKRATDEHLSAPGDVSDHESEWPFRQVPPAVIGFLLLFTVVLAVAFYLAAQLIVTP